MIDILIDALKDTALDTLKLIPFLFLTYLLMEFIEHKTSEKTEHAVQKAGRFGPVIGGLLGVVPQCGFSASAAGLYSGGIISAGTLIAVFLSTSDEMLPIFISEKVEIAKIVEILAIKVVAALIVGFAVDIIIKISHKEKENKEIHCICENEHCHCDEEGILKSAIHHSLSIIVFIFAISLVLNVIICFIGEDKLGELFLNIPVVGSAVASVVGLIPNCAASVVITELYLKEIISTGALISGLLTGCGIGLLVLFRTNKKNTADNVKILLALYFSGVVIGSLVDFIGITI